MNSSPLEEQLVHPKPWLAFILSLALPGVGLFYLKRWRSGIVNLIGVHIVLFALAFVVNDSVINEHLHYVFLILAAGSAGYAHSVARGLLQNKSVGS